VGIDIDRVAGYFFAPAKKLTKLAKQARHLVQRATRNNIWLHVKELQSFASQAAKMGADKLSRHLDNDDKQLDSNVFHEMDTQFGPHTIDRFASALNTLLP
jgi:uncharacterized membrane protein